MPSPTRLVAMKRHSSKSVKMIKIATSAKKVKTKLELRLRNKPVSSKLGKPDRPAPTVCVGASLGLMFFRPAFVARLKRREIDGSRGMRRKTKLKVSIKPVAAQAPTTTGTAPVRESVSPSSEIR